ncbi:S8 family serine peptidase [Streptomyces sp. ODS05-4]|uniref:S8 family serine peptidase n=1 Tax=Streptomyces sp. ODS05-4 TaxID=2944939 RepID=UPI0021094A21|nr:S8 family serine peptidase [Streptomyces sp. ODS05-4]
MLPVVAAALCTVVGATGPAIAAPTAGGRADQWYLEAMHVDEIWKSTKGEGIKVAVIDSGVNSSVPSLRGQVLKGKDLTGVEGDETDDYTGHGTTMAELIAGTGAGGGIQGLAPAAKIIPYRVSDTDLQNTQKVNGFDMQQAIRAAADSDAKVINISMGSEYSSVAEEEVVEYAQRKGKLIFASTGNDAQRGNKENFPAAYPAAVAVAATDPEGVVAKFSTNGTTTDISAPGVNIPGWCDATFTKYCTQKGTSPAAALASATAALIWSKHPEWTGNQVLRVMFESAGRGEGWKPGSISKYVGHGVVRPNAHLTRGLGKPGDPDVSPDTGERVGGKAAAATPKPSEGSAEKPESSSPSDKPALAGSTGTARTADAGDTDTGYLIGGAVAAVVLLGGAGLFVARRRRNT